MRHLYLAFLLAFAVMVFGFWPTTVGPYGPPDALRIWHGAFASGWMALLVIQSWLVGHGRYGAHRWLGRTSLIVAPGLVITAVMVMMNALPTGGAAHFPRHLMLILTWVDLWSLAVFSLLYVLAIVYRRNMALHSRFMASTVFVALIPALGRALGMNIPALNGLEGSLHPCYWIVEIVIAGLIVWDWRNGRRVSPYWLVLIASAAIELTMFAAPDWPPFLAVAHAMGLPR